MAQNFRHDEILALAREGGKVTVEELSNHFGVTAQTIRRDLGELCEGGYLARVHGGAILPSGVINLGYEERSQLATQEKAKMAKLCAQHIPDGASIFLDIGTTTEAVARALLHHKNIVVVTNNINVADIMRNAQTADIFVAGGLFRRNDGALVGDATANFLRQFRVDYAILGVAAIADDGMLLDYDFREVAVTKAVLENARNIYVMADSIKFKRHATVCVSPISEVNMLFTDEEPPAEIRKICDENNVMVEISGH